MAMARMGGLTATAPHKAWNSRFACLTWLETVTALDWELVGTGLGLDCDQNRDWGRVRG